MDVDAKVKSREYSKKYREKHREKVKERRRIDVKKDTYDRWNALRSRLMIANNDDFAILLMETYEDKLRADPKFRSSWKPSEPLQRIPNKGQPHQEPREDPKYLSSWSPGQQNIAIKGQTIASRGQTAVVNNVVMKEKRVTVKEMKPKKKRGRPPKNRPVEIDFGTTKLPTVLDMNRIQVEPPRIPIYPEVSSAPVNNCVSNVDALEDDPLSMSPAVRSARLAFSRALQNSYKALIFQDQPSSTKENDLSLQHHAHGLSTADLAYPLEDLYPQLVQGVVPHQDDRALLDKPQVLESMSCQQTLQHEDHPAMDQDLQDHASLSDVCIQNQLEDLPGQEPEAIRGHSNSRIPLDLVKEEETEPASESQEPGQDQGSPLSDNQLSRGSSAGIRKVPDPMRRSRLNQITGGLLNKLKMKAEGDDANS